MIHTRLAQAAAVAALAISTAFLIPANLQWD